MTTKSTKNDAPEKAPETTPEGLRSRRLTALSYGAVCHLLFLVGVTAMALALASGMQSSLGGLEGRAAWIGNSLLIVQFPVLHSLLLSSRGRAFYRWFAPGRHVKTLSTTLYASFASLQVLLLFTLWSPLSQPFWVAEGSLATLSWTLYALSWALLGKSMLDANLAIQSGSLGWLAMFRGRDPEYGSFSTEGLFSVCRQPIYLSFALITWTGPAWTVDKIIVATCLTGYCLVGPILKERRFARIHGDAFREYQRRVPYLPLLPLLAPVETSNPRSLGH